MSRIIAREIGENFDIEKVLYFSNNLGINGRKFLERKSTIS